MSDDPPFSISQSPSTRSEATGTSEPDDLVLCEDDSESESAPPSSPGSSAPDPFSHTLDSDLELADREPGRASSSLSNYQLPESSYYYDSIDNVHRSSAPATPPSPFAALNSLPQPSNSDFKSTPVKATLSSVNPHAILPLEGKKRGPSLIDLTGMAPRWHLLSEEKFISDIPGALPTDDQRSRFAAYDTFDDVSKEWHIYPKLSEIGNSVFQEASCADLRLLITANHKDKTGTKTKHDTFNDGGVYRTTELVNDATTLTLTAKDREKVTNQLALALLDSGNYGRASFHHVSVPIEVKYDYAYSAFTFTPPSKQKSTSTVPHTHVDEADLAHSGDHVDGADASAEDQAAVLGAQNVEDDEEAVFHTMQVPEFIHGSVKGQAGLSQLGEYMFKTFKYQHRIFSFAIYIYRDMCRLLRFDHSGAFVTPPFRWTSRDSALHSFLWKIASISDKDRLAVLGYDPTANPASDKERAMFAALQYEDYLPQEVRTYVKQATSNNAPVYKVQVMTSPPTDDERLPDDPTSNPTSKNSSRAPDTSGHRTHEFLIGDPLFAAEALVGRCTKGYVAYRLGEHEHEHKHVSDEDRLCFLKDCWRPYVAGRTRPEHLIYQHLHSQSVNFIASLICGGDVGGPRSQITTVQDYLSDEPRLRPVPRVHYRLVTQEIGIPVTEFKTFQELAGVFVNALDAHAMAWKQAQILHRDISVGNIMINPKNREGFLIDWDLSRFEPELGNGPVEPDRSGTWQYRSALLLQFPRKPCRPSDDIESFVHAFRQLIVRFIETSVTSTLSDHVKAYYEQAFWQGGVMMGGDFKLSQFMSPLSAFRVQGDKPLDALVTLLAKECASFYADVDLARMQEVYGIEKEPPTEHHDHTDDYTTPIQVTVKSERLNKDEIAGFQSMFGPTASDPTAHAANAHASTENTDPCAVHGFLSSHSTLLAILTGFATSGSISPKGRDNFALLRASAHGNSTFTSQSRTGTVTREFMAWNSGSPFIVNRRLDSPHLPTPSSGESASSQPHSRTRKRARQDEVEEALNTVAHRPVGEASASRSRSRRRSKQAKND